MKPDPTSHNVITTFGLLRHGVTVWNEESRIQGSQDSPLSDAGKKALSHIAPYLFRFGWTKILASDLGRVKESVAIINTDLQLPVYYDMRLREIDWGCWEGRTFEEIREGENNELNRQILAGWHFQAPQGESRAAALQRSRAALFDAAKSWAGEKILVICHQGIIKCLIYGILKSSFLPDENARLKKDALQLITISDSVMECNQLNISPPEFS